MTVQAEAYGQPERLIKVERFLSQQGNERWCKTFSPLYPAADYWLCHESRVLQGFQRDPRFAAHFIAVDLDRRVIVSEAPGYPLTHWLATPAGELEHPFQRSSELVRLILASLRALAHLSRSGLVHGGLRPDVIVLRQNDSGEIDFGSLSIIDFSVARSNLHRIEKPLFIDLASADAVYLSPSMREAVERDWQTYAKVCGESGKSTWYELSDSARRQYESVLMPDLAINTLDWRVDLYALGHWFRQISLHRIDYFRDAHQESLPALIKRMQKSMLQGGFASLESCIKAFEALEIDSRVTPIPAPPPNSNVVTMQPSPVIRLPNPVSSDGTTEVVADDAFAPIAPSIKPDGAQHNPRLIGMALGIVVVGLALVAYIKTQDTHETAKLTVASSAETVPQQAAATGGAVVSSAPPAATAPVTAPTPVEAAPAAVIDQATLEKLPLPELRAAAEKGDAAAQTQLGLRYRKGQGVPADNDKAVEWYRKAAEQQHADAQAYLGFMYMTGRGVKKDDAEALKWSKLSAEQGNSTGQYNLGMLYLSGRGVAADRVEAYRWLKKAAAKDDGAKARLAEIKKKMTAAELAKVE